MSLSSKLKIFSFLFLFGNSIAATAQDRINLSRDTISHTAAKNAQSKFKNDMSSGNKKATSAVSFKVGQLDDIIQACKQSGIGEIRFMIVTLQKQDTAHYFSHHRGLTTASKNDVIGRQTLVIKVPRAAFASFTQSSSFNLSEHPLMISLASAGLLYIKKPYGNIPQTDEDVYFEIGEMCPPPAVCN